MADPVDAAADLLYGLPLDEFTPARNAAAKELRDRGLGAEAEAVKALAKPTVAAWAVNQLTRRRHADLDEFLEAAAAARDAQLGGGAEAREAIKPSARRARDARRRGTRRARRRGVRGGHARIRQTLEAAAVDDGAAEDGASRAAGEGARAGRVRDARRAREAGPRKRRSGAAHGDAAAARRRWRTPGRSLREAEDEHRAAARRGAAGAQALAADPGRRRAGRRAGRKGPRPSSRPSAAR